MTRHRRPWPRAWLVGVGISCLAVAATGTASATAPAAGLAPGAGPSSVHRDGHHSATALGDGRVLVAGGGEPAEMFDPAAGTWTPTGPMGAKRSDHSATLLADGRVLVAGGVGDAGALASAEVFDPATAQWAPTGSLTLARFAHTATALADGKVLVSGGLEAGHGPFRREAEMFDPATGAWSPAGAMELGRAYHTATLLADGTVLVAGGQGAAHDRSLSDAVVFDPASRTWAAVPHLMRVARAQHSATLLPDGTVLLAGGTRQREGQQASDVEASTEIYDPGDHSFRLAPPMGTSRVSHTATVLAGGQVYVLGGAGTADESGIDEAASAEVFDLVGNRWQAASAVTAAPRLHTATLLGPRGCGVNCGRVLVVSPTSAQIANPSNASDHATSTPMSTAGSQTKGSSDSTALPVALVVLAAGAAGALGAVALHRRRVAGGPA